MDRLERDTDEGIVLRPLGIAALVLASAGSTLFVAGFGAAPSLIGGLVLAILACGWGANPWMAGAPAAIIYR